MQTLSTRAIAIALQELGIEEIKGVKDNPRIIEYQHSVDGLDGLYGDETPWCSCFANWCVQKAGGRGTRNPMARSWLKWGKEASEPKYGDIVVLWRVDPKLAIGHVGFFIADKGRDIQIISGNHNNKVTIDLFPKNQVIEYRRSADS